MDPILNFAKVTVSTGYDASATSVVLASGHGARLPSTFSYNMVWWNSTDYADPADDPNVEVVRVSGRSTDTISPIARAQESTAASTKNTAGKTYRMILAITKKTIDDIIADYISNLVEDITPQLGGDLDLNGKNIDFPTTPNISDCLDEDTMVSDSPTMLATQQSIKAYVDALSTGLPSGTKILFKQATAPTGWTIDDTITDKSAVRYTRGATYGADAGSVNLETGVSTTQGHSLSIAELAAHTHSISIRDPSASGTTRIQGEADAETATVNTGSTGSGNAHSHDIELRYTDVIVATKD